jgi:acetyl esterase/lipase
MVMADRPGVATAPAPIAAIDMTGLVATIASGLLRLPFRHPTRGAGSIPRNVGVSVTRELARSFLGYAMARPIDEFRSIELVLDRISGAVLPYYVALQDVATASGTVGGVPGLWLRPRDATPRAKILYLHGGGYIGTSPNMYTAFGGHLARATRCEIFIADYRLAPEFPYPAALDDALDVLAALYEKDGTDVPLFLAGDSGGGGLAGSVLYECGVRGLPVPDGVLLFSPEISLLLDEPSVTENAALDVLPWNVPTNSYLHGVDPTNVAVSGSDVSRWPPTFISYGGDEIFRDPIRGLVARLRAAGIDTDAHEQPGTFHVFPVLVPWAASSRATYARAGAFVSRLETTQAARRAASAS